MKKFVARDELQQAEAHFVVCLHAQNFIISSVLWHEIIGLNMDSHSSFPRMIVSQTILQ